MWYHQFSISNYTKLETLFHVHPQPRPHCPPPPSLRLLSPLPPRPFAMTLSSSPPSPIKSSAIFKTPASMSSSVFLMLNLLELRLSSTYPFCLISERSSLPASASRTSCGFDFFERESLFRCSISDFDFDPLFSKQRSLAEKCDIPNFWVNFNLIISNSLSCIWILSLNWIILRDNWI